MRADSGCAQAQISQKHRDMTGEHKCMNWQNLGMNDTDGKQDRQDNKKNVCTNQDRGHSDHNTDPILRLQWLLTSDIHVQNLRMGEQKAED